MSLIDLSKLVYKHKMTDWNTFAAAEASGDKNQICQLLEHGLAGEPAWKTLYYRVLYAAGTSYQDQALKDYETLSRMEAPEWWHRSQAREALKKYRLERLVGKEEKYPLHLPGHKDSSILVPMNPSLVLHQGQLWINLRMVDWFLDLASGDYGTRDPRGRFRTKNLLGPYGSLDQMQWLRVDSPPKIRQHQVRGFEDCRYFSYQGRLGFVGLSTRTHPEHTHKLSLGWISEGKMTEITPLRLSNQAQTQKNWLPFIYQDQIHLVYGYSPFCVLKYDLEQKKVEKVLELETYPGWTDFCGGAPPIPFEGGWLMVIHTLSYRNNNTKLRTYWHRFLWLDSELKPNQVSREFRLACNDIEYVSGLAQDPETGLIGLGYGYRDREARIRWVQPVLIQEMLKPLDNPA